MLERMETLRNGVMRVPFEMTTVDKLFKNLWTDKMIYSIGTTKLRQKHSLNGVFCCQILLLIVDCTMSSSYTSYIISAYYT